MNQWPRQAIKVCGVRTVEHALAAANAGADYIGMIFAPGRRQIDQATAQAIVAALQETAALVQTVGVFVNEAAATINSIAATVGLDVVQLSGDEREDYVAALRLPVFKTIRLTNDPGEHAWQQQAMAHPARVRLLIDAHVPGSYGGAGVVADWQRAMQIATTTPLLLAGGLNSTNVAAAIETVKPWGVDVSSGVETDGIKDKAKITAFVAAARTALGRLHS